MRQYEVTFVVDPVLSGDEVKATAQKYLDLIVAEGGTMVHVDEMGLKALAYPINRRHSGIYYCAEYQLESSEMIPKMELLFRRDEKILRFLNVILDKFGVLYNADKRSGKIGKARPSKKALELVAAAEAAARKAEAAANAPAPVVASAPQPAVVAQMANQVPIPMMVETPAAPAVESAVTVVKSAVTSTVTVADTDAITIVAPVEGVSNVTTTVTQVDTDAITIAEPAEAVVVEKEATESNPEA